MTAKVSTAIRFGEAEKAFIGSYADMLGMTFSDFVRKAALERIEDDLDIIAYNNARADDDGVRYSTAEVLAMIDSEDWYGLDG